MSIVQNKKAFHDYFIEERFEAGVALEGWEVKSLREGKAQLVDSYVLIKNGDMQVAFDPYDSDYRTGRHPDIVLAEMRAAGFVTNGQNSDNADATEYAFALTERLTRVPMTTTLLHSATYVVTAIHDADTAAWEQENPDPGLQPAW